MTIATWNVNGIRARHGQLLDLIERDRPDVICLQEIKASVDQIPLLLCDLAGYWCYWHGGKGYSGVALHVSRERWPERPAFHHPEFDFEHRIVTTVAERERAPFEMTGPVLRVSPHVDATIEDLERLAEALTG